jgi:type I restriction-modification system methyltransferase subunit
VFVLVLEKNSENILVVDASKDFVKSGKNNVMEQAHIDKVLKAFFDFKEVKKFAHVASYEEIKDNDFNLNIPRYVDTYEPEPLPDMKTLLKELEEIRQEERKTISDLYEMLGDLVGPVEDMAIIDTHRQILLEDMNNES